MLVHCRSSWLSYGHIPRFTDIATFINVSYGQVISSEGNSILLCLKLRLEEVVVVVAERNYDFLTVLQIRHIVLVREQFVALLAYLATDAGSLFASGAFFKRTGNALSIINVLV